MALRRARHRRSQSFPSSARTAATGVIRDSSSPTDVDRAAALATLVAKLVVICPCVALRTQSADAEVPQHEAYEDETDKDGDACSDDLTR